jgi:nucleoside-diphosphate-sugar epimerase
MILVTGATGLAGSYLVRMLGQYDLGVRAFVREASAPALDASDAEIAIGDLADHDSLLRACDGVTGIVHTACTFTDSAIDIGAMQVLLDGWRDGPFVFFSSLDVYGYSKTPLITEMEPLDETHSDYAHGKVICEQLLLEKAGQKGRLDQVSILRASHIVGPHPKVYGRLIGLLGDKDTIVLPGASESEWSQCGDAYIDVRDLAWIVAECLRRPIGGPVNVLAGHFVWHDLCAEVIRLTGQDCRIVHKSLDQISADEQPERILFSQSWKYDNRRLLEMLGFQPTYTWKQTVAETIRAGQADPLENEHEG